MNDTQQKIYEILSRLTGEKVIDILTDYRGLQILDNGLAEHLVDEGEASESDFPTIFE